MTFPRLYEIWEGWRKTPPLHRAFVGLLKSLGGKGGTTPTTHEGDNADLLRELGAAGVSALPSIPAELQALLPIE